jgi:hypothetical protein
MRRLPALPAAALLLAAAGTVGCGYRVAGKADTLPRTIHTIAIPAFDNNTTRYKLTQQLAEAVTYEFVARTRYKVVPDASAADAVLAGAILSYNSYPTTYDPVTGRASAAQLSLVLDVTLRERATGTVLFSRKTMEFRERYEISIDPNTYFEESDTALRRVSRDVARSLVSAVLERF